MPKTKPKTKTKKRQWTLGDSARARARARARERFRLYAKPARAPKWWPRKAGRAVWVGVARDGGGWAVGPGDALTRVELATARKYVEIPGKTVRFRVVPVGLDA